MDPMIIIVVLSFVTENKQSSHLKKVACVPSWYVVKCWLPRQSKKDNFPLLFALEEI